MKISLELELHQKAQLEWGIKKGYFPKNTNTILKGGFFDTIKKIQDKKKNERTN